jgi:hypothetical protein
MPWSHAQPDHRAEAGTVGPAFPLNEQPDQNAGEDDQQEGGGGSGFSSRTRVQQSQPDEKLDKQDAQRQWPGPSRGNAEFLECVAEPDRIGHLS